MFKTNHKPLEWLAIVSNVYSRMGRWIDTLQDFSFKIVHRTRAKHTNVDALSRNTIDEWEDIIEEIQDPN
jgi:hypothetical protein